jgi:hypothetical protein
VGYLDSTSSKGTFLTGNHLSAKREAVLGLSIAAYQQWKSKLTGGFENAARFLRQESFFSTRDLPYSTQLVPLAAVMALLGDDWRQPVVYDKLTQWYWCGVLGELYGGAVETLMALDVQDLIAWIRGQGDEPTTVRDANFQPSRLETLRSRNSAAYKGVSTLILRDGAKDFFWKSKVKDLDETDWEGCQLDIHHIFPTAWCEGQKISAKRYNSILNKTAISFKANRMIGGKAPSKYLEQLQNHQAVQLDMVAMDEILLSHSIAPESLRQDDFEAFMASRQCALLTKISAVMGKSMVFAEEAVGEDFDEDAE